MWAGTGKSKESLASAQCGDGQSPELARALAKEELGGFYHPGQTVPEDWKRSLT